jgi:hypothetical protein
MTLPIFPEVGEKGNREFTIEGGWVVEKSVNHRCRVNRLRNPDRSISQQQDNGNRWKVSADSLSEINYDPLERRITAKVNNLS